MSFLEQIAKSIGVSSKELFSGKYGNNYHDILINLGKKKKESDMKVEKALKQLKKKGWKVPTKIKTKPLQKKRRRK